jgi:hypothetical protein
MEKSRQEIDDLKRQWERDPEWDIEETEGFESYREELKEYADAKRAEWQKAYEEKESRELKEDCEKWGCSNPQLRNVIKDLLRRNEKLQEAYNELDDKFYNFRDEMRRVINDLQKSL